MDGFGFTGYTVQTVPTPDLFVAIVGLLVSFAVAFSAPFAYWIRDMQRRRQFVDPYELENREPVDFPEQNPLDTLAVVRRGTASVTSGSTRNTRRSGAQKISQSIVSTASSKRKTATSLLRGETNSSHSILERLSATHSAATTSRLRTTTTTRATSATVLSGRRAFKRHGGTITQIQYVRKRIERKQNPVRTASDVGSAVSTLTPLSTTNISQAAGSALAAQKVYATKESRQYRRRFKSSHRRPSSSRRSQSTMSSLGGSSDVGSIMPPLQSDAVLPEDAPDAAEVGRYLGDAYGRPNGSVSVASSKALSSQFSTLLNLVDPEFETKQIATLGIPSTAVGLADPLFRLILLALISEYVDTESMVAFLIVLLCVRLTLAELSGTISDAEQGIVQDCLVAGGEEACWFVGATMVVGMTTQLIAGGAMLAVWYFGVQNLVEWLVADAQIAELAQTYVVWVAAEYTMRGVSRAFFLPFFLTGQGRFEHGIDVAHYIVVLLAVGIVGSQSNELTLEQIGIIQVMSGGMKLFLKVAVVVVRGWHLPYKKGLRGCGDFSRSNLLVKNFLKQVLLLGIASILDLEEWGILTLLVQSMGSAEVATWTTMGVVWEILIALSEGLGAASESRVSFYLNEGQPLYARKLSHKVVLIGFFLVLTVSSCFLMFGPRIAVLLTKDLTLEHMFINLVGLTCLASVAMAFTQIYWYLACAQQQWGAASASVNFCRWLVMLPMASVCIFYYDFDLIAVVGSIAVGYAVSAFLLAVVVFRVSWHQLADALRQDQEIDADEDMADEGSESSGSEVLVESSEETSDEEDPESSSEGFFGSQSYHESEELRLHSHDDDEEEDDCSKATSYLISENRSML